ncbi:uncharacterized protein ZBAI_02993 [Zygosaccharomyces bailii ISA1307]|nr:uncharacterized protein ZBAI_02993 [Zygosaccharomyces bailii ISA1307]
MLLSQPEIFQKTLDEQLITIKCDATDKKAVTETLVAKTNNEGKIELVSFVFFGIGGSPSLKLSLRNPVTLDNPSVCEKCMQAIVDSLKEIRLVQDPSSYVEPSLAAVSTTGISDGPTDVPLGLVWMYHYLLAVPHEDKRKMECLAQYAVEEHLTNHAVVVRCSLLTGDHKIKVQSRITSPKVGSSNNPSIGYTVSRTAVGEWIFNNLLISSDQQQLGFKVVTLTE